MFQFTPIHKIATFFNHNKKIVLTNRILFQMLNKVSFYKIHQLIFYLTSSTDYGVWPTGDSRKPNWHFAQSRRGATILIVNGYQFYRYANSSAGPAKRWLCNAYRHHG